MGRSENVKRKRGVVDRSIKNSNRPMQQVVMSCSYQKLPELRSSSFAVSLERDSMVGKVEV